MKFYNLINKAEEESAELYIEGEIVEEGWEREFLSDVFGGKATASNEFTDMLKSLNNKPLKIHCNSYGGLLMGGVAMYCALTEYKGKKTGYIDALCASAATLPMLACDKVYMTAASGYCAHLPMSGMEVYGNRIEIKEQVEGLLDYLEQAENRIINAYQRKTGLGTEKIRNILEKDEIMTAKQAIEYGFVDGYTEDEPKFDMAFVENMFKRNVMVYNSLKPKYEPKQEPIEEPKNEPITDEKPLVDNQLTEEEIKAREEKERLIKAKFEFLKLKR